MMVEERQRRTGGQRMQPQRHLRQLHRHRVFIDAEHAALEHHAPHNRLVVDHVIADAPFVLRRQRLDAAADF